MYNIHIFAHFSMKMLLSNKDYVILVIALGSGVGIFSMLATQIEQFACARGYDNSFSSLAITLMLVVGLFGALLAGVIVNITGRIEEVTKICGGVACISGIVVNLFLRKPEEGGWILASISL